MYSNVVPQWQVVNNGNWRDVEEAVRARAKLRRSTMQVFTGTKGVLKLRGKMLWLVKDSIPGVSFKVEIFPDLGHNCHSLTRTWS